MPHEIERKFLVNHERWNQLSKSEGKKYRQGYLVVEDEKVIRVRRTPEKGFITIKGKSVGITRAEYEYEIPAEEAEELISKFANSIISKTRYNIEVSGKVWEVDVFEGDNEGLIVAEIELKYEDEAFVRPDWIGEEVTDQERYYNSRLAVEPFTQWHK